MFRDDAVEIWNLTEGGTLETGCQEIVMVVGRLLQWEFGTRASYRLNGGPHRPMALYDMRFGRLGAFGEFGIDSIHRDDLVPGENEIEIDVRRPANRRSTSRVTFTPVRSRYEETRFSLPGDSVGPIEEFGQVVDGRWSVDRDQHGTNVTIAPGDEGYDRIVLFGDETWHSDYELVTEFTLDAYPNGYHSFGPVFRWRPHVQGDGRVLPREWTSALAIYSSGRRGLTLRSGHQVAYGPDGTRSGHIQHAARRVSTVRAARARLSSRVPGLPHVPEYPVGRPLRMTLTTRGERARVTLEPSGWRGVRRRATVSATLDDARVRRGAVGFLAAYCSVRIHRFDVRPIAPPARTSPRPD